jgi:hypothetical protein
MPARRGPGVPSKSSPSTAPRNRYSSAGLQQERPLSRGLRVFTIVSAALFLLGLFSTEIYDSDFWWHLKTGQYIWQNHRLPVPDPFTFTTASAPPAYPGEDAVRRFNLTHEWLSQVLLYAAYQALGFPGIVLLRAALLAALCALAGIVAFRRSEGFYRALAASFATASVAIAWAFDRPYLWMFLFIAATIAVLEAGRTRRTLWLLPPLFLVWSNLHGGFFLGWAVLGAYCADAVVSRLRNGSSAGDRSLWIASALSVVSSGLNPNGFLAVKALMLYRQSFLQSTLQEWARPRLWPPDAFTILLALGAAVLIWRYRQVRLRDWLLFAAFAAASLMAKRNVVLIGVVAPILIATYFPAKVPVPAYLRYALAGLLLCGLGAGIARGSFFQLRVADWRFPVGAADFLQAHRISQPMFNTYEYGGYLIWRLAPEPRVFIDGRALSESVFGDYVRMLYNHDASGGKSGEELLDQYGIQVIVMNSFEYVSGALYKLAPSFVYPAQTTLKLVYRDPEAMVLMRNPPAGMETLNPAEVLDHMEQECESHIRHEPQYPRCARSIAQVFSRTGDAARARRWLGIYLSHPHGVDPEAERAWLQYANSGR